MDLLPKMESEERIDSEITHRKGKEKLAIEDENSEIAEENSAQDQENDQTPKSELEEKNDPPKIRPQEDFTTWGAVKYRFYLFRYYHYYYADKLDKYLAAGCLWIMRVYFRFLGLVEEAEEDAD